LLGGGRYCIVVVVLKVTEGEDTKLAVQVTFWAFMEAERFRRLNGSSFPVELMGTVPCARIMLLDLMDTLILAEESALEAVTWSIPVNRCAPEMRRFVKAASTMNVPCSSSPSMKG
jgi:hypothetical protein